VGCRLLFATHYHALTAAVAGDPRVAAQHMAEHVHVHNNNNPSS
jgi:DNA mismatch repair ATPase MutS